MNYYKKLAAPLHRVVLCVNLCGPTLEEISEGCFHTLETPGEQGRLDFMLPVVCF